MVDENKRLVGVLTIDDVVDVIQEEAEEDIMLLAGVGDEEISDTVVDTVALARAVAGRQSRHGVPGRLVIGLFERPSSRWWRSPS